MVKERKLTLFIKREISNIKNDRFGSYLISAFKFLLIMSVVFALCTLGGYAYKSIYGIKTEQELEIAQRKADFQAALSNIKQKNEPEADDFGKLNKLADHYWRDNGHRYQAHKNHIATDQQVEEAKYHALVMLLGVSRAYPDLSPTGDYSPSSIPRLIEEATLRAGWQGYGWLDDDRDRPHTQGGLGVENRQKIRAFLSQIEVQSVLEKLIRFRHKHDAEVPHKIRKRLDVALEWYRSIATVPNEFNQGELGALQAKINDKFNNPNAVWNGGIGRYKSDPLIRIRQWPEARRYYYFCSREAANEEERGIEWSPAIKFTNRLFILYGYAKTGSSGEGLRSPLRSRCIYGNKGSSISFSMLEQKGFISNEALGQMTNQQLKQLAEQLVDILADRYRHNLFIEDLIREYRGKIQAFP